MPGKARPGVEVWSHRGRVDSPVNPAGDPARPAGDPARPAGDPTHQTSDPRYPAPDRRHRTDNTVEAVSAALGSGADGVEIDTWRCADGTFMLTHDRATPAGPVDLCPVAALGHLDRLDDVLFAGRRGTLNIELKVPPDSTPSEQAGLGEALASWLQTAVGPEGTAGLALVVSSFSESATRQFLAAGPAVRAGHLCEVVPDTRMLEALAARGYWGVHFLASPAALAGLGAIRAAGLAAVAWTVNDAHLAAQLVAGGVDVIITDTPVAVLRVVDGNGDTRA